jgi:GNAT superfamily N-acetyltransferase
VRSAEDTPFVAVREADLGGPDAAAVSALVRDYLLQTEAEKLREGVPTPTGGVLAGAYLAEVDDPATAYAGRRVLVAELDGVVCGVVVITRGPESEIKRLWAAAAVRGRGVGSALMDAASSAGTALRLSVWEWRTDAIRLYESRGFVNVVSWDSRARLVCMMRPAPHSAASTMRS